MVDITEKKATLRYAKAAARVSTGSVETMRRIADNEIPKGNIFEMAKAAALLGVKKTPELIPDCHPLPVEYAAVNFQTDGLDIHIEVEVKTVYKTGVEVEAMHGASIAALTIYDMLKPIDKNIVIRDIRLLEKRGGKSDIGKSD